MDVSCALVYEVNLEVDAGIADAYRTWLREHVAEMLSLPGFTGAETFELRDPPPPPGRIAFCVQYRMTGDDALQAYLRDHAPRMRADGIARFGERFSASRRVLVAAD